MSFQFSRHALEQMGIRGISRQTVEKVLTHPDQIREEGDKKVYQSIVKNYLIRIFVNDRKKPKLIVTVYKTSKIKKYL